MDIESLKKKILLKWNDVAEGQMYRNNLYRLF